MLNEYECPRCGVICRGYAAPRRCSECGSDRVERRAQPNWMQRAAKPVHVPGEGTKTDLEKGADEESVGGKTCARCGRPLAADAFQCSWCGAVPASALSDAELLASLRATVSRPRPSAEEERAEAARREARRFAMSRYGLIDRDRPAPPPRRAVWLHTVYGPTLVPLPTPSEDAQRDDRPRVLREFDRVQRGMSSYRAW